MARMTAPQAARSAWIFGALAIITWAGAFWFARQNKLYVLCLGLSALGQVFVFVSLGFLVTRRADGVLLSSRNTYSLSRLQMVLWTILVLSAVLAAAACRAWQAGGTGDALNIHIPDELLQVMGISYVSAAAAPAVLALKSQSTNTDAQVVRRAHGAPVLLRDLVTGDDLSNAGVIDLSKLQQLLITILLIVVYAGMLAMVFSKPPFGPPMTELPPFQQSFVTLLLVSHGGYLAYKAVTKPGSGESDAAKPPPGPDRNDGLG